MNVCIEYSTTVDFFTYIRFVNYFFNNYYKINLLNFIKFFIKRKFSKNTFPISPLIKEKNRN